MNNKKIYLKQIGVKCYQNLKRRLLEEDDKKVLENKNPSSIPNDTCNTHIIQIQKKQNGQSEISSLPRDIMRSFKEKMPL